MLIQFSVSNYKSIKDEVILSAVAGSGNEHGESLIEFKNERILPAIAIYGANAAGKSNLFKAITAALIVIRTSNNRQINDTIPYISPFEFDEESSKKPSQFSFIFTSKGIKYEYGFSADVNRIYEEYLYEYKTAKASKVFERTETNKYSFTNALEKELLPFVGKTTDNKLFLSTATAWNCEKTREAYMWLAESIDTFGGNLFEGPALSELDNDADENIKRFVKEMLKAADINISGYQFSSKEIAIDDLPPGLPLPLEAKLSPTAKQFEMHTKHLVKNNGMEKEYMLPFVDESDGTKRLFSYSPIIMKAIELGKTVIIDEIDNSLHPMLAAMLVEMFQDKEINKNGAQLIFNTHDVYLLDLDRFRRDQIYFVEKDNSTGITDLYSLDEFSPRKTENIRKGYLQGRYGAIPMVGLGGMEW